MKLFLLSAIVAVAFCYDIDPSGYGGNDAEAVKKVAAASPRVRPRDYTSNGKPINDPVVPKYNVPSAADIIGNKFNLQNLQQNNNQGQSSVQVGGEQTNVGSNANAINIGQTNQNGGGKGSGYPAPQYDSKYAPSYPQPNTYVPQVPSYGGAGAGDVIKNNLFNMQNLGQTNNQGQSSAQIGGAQTNVGQNQNAINIGQTNNNGGQGSGYGAPQYDSKYAPSYPQQPSYAQYLPQNIFAGNKVDYTGLAQNNQQGQSNTQVGGEQTNFGSNANAINIGQTNQNGGGKGSGYPAPQYDSKYVPSYPQPTYTQQPSYAQYLPQNIFAGNKIDSKELAQNNNQGQSNTQVGGAQTNFGSNENAINIGQTNNNGGGKGSGYPAPQYDSKYVPSYPQPNTYVPQVPSYGGSGAGDVVKNNLFNIQNLGQTSSQGQENVQVGGAQTNVGQNQNAINIGQTNQNGGGKGSGYPAPQYDSKYAPSYPQQPSYPSYGSGAGYIPQNIFAGNKVDYTGLAQGNNQGQSSVQQGGAQTNVGQNQNAINIGQTNNNGGQGSGYGAPQYDYGKGKGGGDTHTEDNRDKNTFTQAGLVGLINAPLQIGSPTLSLLDDAGYKTYPVYPDQIAHILGNRFNMQNLAQTSSQGQQNVQVGGAQTNVGSNSNSINLGQTNNNAGQGKGSGYPAPQYDSKYAPSYPQPTYTQQPSYAQYLPQNIFAGNKIDSKELAQNNNQGQSNTQVGGAQTNVGSNANTINVGQTNNNGGGQKTPSYDAKIKKAPEPEPEQAYRRRA